MRILLFSMPDMVPAFKGWRPPNLAISSIAGNLTGHDVRLADLILVQHRLTSAIKKLLSEYKPAVIGMSAMSFQFDTARRIAAFIKNVDSTIKIVLGVYHATLMYKEIGEEDKDGTFVFILRGERDLSFGELINALQGKTKSRAYETERAIKDISHAKREGGKYIAVTDNNITLNPKRFNDFKELDFELH